MSYMTSLKTEIVLLMDKMATPNPLTPLQNPQKDETEYPDMTEKTTNTHPLHHHASAIHHHIHHPP